MIQRRRRNPDGVVFLSDLSDEGVGGAIPIPTTRSERTTPLEVTVDTAPPRTYNDSDIPEGIPAVSLSDEERKAGRENYDFYCFLIWPFIEAAWLAAVSLMGLTPPPGRNGDVWIEQSKAHSSAQLVSASGPQCIRTY